MAIPRLEREIKQLENQREDISLNIKKVKEPRQAAAVVGMLTDFILFIMGLFTQFEGSLVKI